MREDRLRQLLSQQPKSGGRLFLRIKGKVQLKVWVREDTFFIRVDAHKQYSVPLGPKVVDWLDSEVLAVVASKYQFKNCLQELPSFLEDTASLKETTENFW